MTLASVAEADLVAHYPLDDPPGTSGPGSVAETVSGFNGTPTDPGAAPAFGAAGANAATGTAADFSNTSIDVAYNDALNPESFTLTAWAKPTIADGNPYSVFTNREDLGPGVTTGGFVLYNIGGTWQFWTGVGDTAAAGEAVECLGRSRSGGR